MDIKLEKNKKYTVYVVKYALTQGIYKAQVVYSGISEMVCTEDKYHMCYHGINKDYSFTFEEAKKIAEKMKVKKIASLKKKLERLEKITFECPE
jgi:hypothetical protein